MVSEPDLLQATVNYRVFRSLPYKLNEVLTTDLCMGVYNRVAYVNTHLAFDL